MRDAGSEMRLFQRGDLAPGGPSYGSVLCDVGWGLSSATREGRSRKAAQKCSPRRKPSVRVENELALEQRNRPPKAPGNIICS
jgi:hypothetical protein